MITKRKRRTTLLADDRKVAVYSRKSVITNKGDSIGVQIKQSKDYAASQLNLPEEYEFLEYSDKGLSGYYSDRPDFQRMLRDIDAGKIKAIACYKLDRISRKTSDLMRLLEYLERRDVILLVCSNNINTQISTSKIIIQVLAIIAEFERDILTERIQDNLMELAKDGRWMGGTTPTGFTKERVGTGSGKNKSAVSFLVPIPEERILIKKLFQTFLDTRSLNATATILNREYRTKNGAAFTMLAVKDILKNPIYCTADREAYLFFMDKGANISGDETDYDGLHGISAYNKTDQMKLEDENSTFFHPRFVKATERKPVEEWIVSVGKHEGMISSATWIAAQDLLETIAERYNRPHRRTNALLAGLIFCPHCGKRLKVVPESGRWQNGKPRFKYVCPGFRKKECQFKAIDGVILDEFVVSKIADLSDRNNEYAEELFETRLSAMIKDNTNEQEVRELEASIGSLKNDIAAQVRNMREADMTIRKFIQNDIAVMSAELEKKERLLNELSEEDMLHAKITKDLVGVREKLKSFKEFAAEATPEVLVTLLQVLIEKVYIIYKDGVPVCHIYLKGCPEDDYSSFFGAAGYIPPDVSADIRSDLMCDSDRGRECHSQRGRNRTAGGVQPSDEP
ncbi:MAG: recombinase family protein [Eubacteriales bacterium]|nr:recombinase family protein [Eubacteriales bacterium]